MCKVLQHFQVCNPENSDTFTPLLRSYVLVLSQYTPCIACKHILKHKQIPRNT